MPFDPDEPWTCASAVESCKAVLQTMSSVDLIEAGPSVDAVDGGIIGRCQPCRAGSSSPRRCRGWTLTLRGANRLRFRGRAAGRPLVVSIEGHQDQRHPARELPGSKVPAASSLSITVLNPQGQVLTRQHSDVGNQGQRGAVGHIQLGGLPSFGPRPDLEWLDVPRWPAPPMDFMLITELAIYSFAEAEWESVRNQNTWKQWVQRSESLAYSIWRRQFEDYWSRRARAGTWLAFQCNAGSPWDRSVP
jgi:hypothetical protein